MKNNAKQVFFIFVSNEIFFINFYKKRHKMSSAHIIVAKDWYNIHVHTILILFNINLYVLNNNPCICTCLFCWYWLEELTDITIFIFRFVISENYLKFKIIVCWIVLKEQTSYLVFFFFFIYYRMNIRWMNSYINI